MKNFKSRIPLGEDKWAFEQTEVFSTAARSHIRRICKAWKPPPYFFHLQKGGHVAAVQAHLASHAFAKVDLRRFFEQVTRPRIVKRLVALGYGVGEAVDFAVASTVRRPWGPKKFVLPYGFVQSSLLASVDLDASALGQKIRELRAAGLCITVYVDDIVISSPSTQMTGDGLTALRNAAQVSNYEINESKSCPVAPSMSAFNIEFTNSSMLVAPARMMQFAEQILMHGDSPEAIAIWAYVRSVNHAQAQKLANDFPQQLAAKIHDVA